MTIFSLTGLIAVSTLSFVCWEQANLIKSLQKTLESICRRALLDEVDKDSTSTGDEASQ